MQGKPKPKKKIRQIIGVGILLALALFTLVPRCSSIIDLYGQVQVLEAEKEKILAEQERLKLEKEKVEKIETVERLAREKLGLVKPGERVILEINP